MQKKWFEYAEFLNMHVYENMQVFEYACFQQYAGFEYACFEYAEWFDLAECEWFCLIVLSAPSMQAKTSLLKGCPSI